MFCWKCGKENKIDVVGHSTECEFCFADLHCCKGCRFYSVNSHFDCKENISEPVADKEKANFCDFFMNKTDDGVFSAEKNKENKADKAKNQLAALFGEAVTEEKKDADSAKAAFNSLFGD